MTAPPGAPAAEAILLRDGRIAAVGPIDELRAPPATRELDAGGRRVIPGLIDSHAHVLRAGLTWEREVHWSGVESLERTWRSSASARSSLAPASGSR